MTEPKGPYGLTYSDAVDFELTGPGLPAKQIFKQEPIIKMVVRFMNLAYAEGYKAGRASLDGFREASQLAFK